jgi:hypothetical protein
VAMRKAKQRLVVLTLDVGLVYLALQVLGLIETAFGGGR